MFKEFQRAFIGPIMPRDSSLSDSCTPNCCFFYPVWSTENMATVPMPIPSMTDNANTKYIYLCIYVLCVSIPLLCFHSSNDNGLIIIHMKRWVAQTYTYIFSLVWYMCLYIFFSLVYVFIYTLESGICVYIYS